MRTGVGRRYYRGPGCGMPAVQYTGRLCLIIIIAQSYNMYHLRVCNLYYDIIILHTAHTAAHCTPQHFVMTNCSLQRLIKLTIFYYISLNILYPHVGHCITSRNKYLENTGNPNIYSQIIRYVYYIKNIILILYMQVRL